MVGFEDRKDSFENKYAHDEKLSFEIEARCCKIFGFWVAEKLGLSGPEADTYAGEVVASNLEEAGFNDVLRKVKPDLADKNVEISDEELNAQIEKALAQAKQEKQM